MAMLAMAVPILPGQTERWRRFVGELEGGRREAYRANRQRLGIRERAFFQATPHGDLVTLVLEGDDPAAAFARFGAEDDEFTRWFVEEVQAIHGFDLRQPPPGPPQSRWWTPSRPRGEPRHEPPQALAECPARRDRRR